MAQQENTAKKPKIESKRNAEKHPLVTVDARGTALQRNNVLGIYFHRTQADFKHASVTTFGKNDAGTPNNSTHGSEHVNPPVPPSMAKEGEPLSDDNLAKLHALIKFAEKQVNYDYRGCVDKNGARSTDVVLARYAESENPTFTYEVKTEKNEKEKSNHPEVPLGRCLWYVKIALFITKYVDGISGTRDANKSGGDWDPTYQYKKVTNLSDVEIRYEKVHTIKEKGKPPVIAEKPLLLTQPDLMHTLPGDVIVYDQVDPVDATAPGHIDIRTYHGFCSDFAWPRPIPALGQSSKKRYQVKAVYRKISDTMAMVRVEAYLRLIREHVAGETSLTEKNRSYQLKQYDKDAKNPFADLNTELKTHPLTTEKLKPAGAYQISYETWSRVTDATGWPKNFATEMQDRVAIYLLQEKPLRSMPHPRRSALGYIMENKLDEAVKLIKQEGELAHWPGGNKNLVDFATLKTKFDIYVSDAAKIASEAEKK